MKKPLLVFALLAFAFAFAFVARAQAPKEGFKFDFSAGYAQPTQGYGLNNGVTLVIEPHGYLSKNFAVGLRLEGAFLGYHPDYTDELFSFFGSTVVTGDLYLSQGTFRPFIGIGGGLFARHYILIDGEDGNLYNSDYTDIKLGFTPRAGFEVGHIRVAATYNVVAANFSYASITIGYVAW